MSELFLSLSQRAMLSLSHGAMFQFESESYV